LSLEVPHLRVLTITPVDPQDDVAAPLPIVSVKLVIHVECRSRIQLIVFALRYPHPFVAIDDSLAIGRQPFSGVLRSSNIEDIFSDIFKILCVLDLVLGLVLVNFLFLGL
jgi:hypothetical protein